MQHYENSTPLDPAAWVQVTCRQAISRAFTRLEVQQRIHVLRRLLLPVGRLAFVVFAGGVIVGAIVHVLTTHEATAAATTRSTPATHMDRGASVADADESSTFEVIGKALLWGTVGQMQSKPKGGGELRGSYLPSRS